MTDRNRTARPRTRVGKPEFNPASVSAHQDASKVDRLHMRALHLATVKQIGGER